LADFRFPKPPKCPKQVFFITGLLFYLFSVVPGWLACLCELVGIAIQITESPAWGGAKVLTRKTLCVFLLFGESQEGEEGVAALLDEQQNVAPLLSPFYRLAEFSGILNFASIDLFNQRSRHYADAVGL